MSRPTNVDESVRERLLKVLRLAKQGVGGEKANAEALLAKLLKKHKLPRSALDAIDGEPRRTVWLKFSGEAEGNIVTGIVYSICTLGRDVEQWRAGKRRNVWGFDLTIGEAVAVKLAWEVYKPAFHAAVIELSYAFCLKHALYDQSPHPTMNDDSPEVKTREQRERGQRIAAMIDGLDHVERPQRRLPAGAA